MSCLPNYFLEKYKDGSVSKSRCVTECPAPLLSRKPEYLCVSCDDNCEVCQTYDKCEVCKSNYFNEGGCCILCNECCATCKDEGPFECLTCPTGFYLTSTGTCDDSDYAGLYKIKVANIYSSTCVTNCDVCESANTCEKCQTTHTLDMKNKKTCWPHSEDSTKCSDGRFLEILSNNYYCHNCTANCKVCDTKTGCCQCNVGFYVKSGNNTCGRCPTDCDSCSADNKCTKCRNGFYLYDNDSKCVKCTLQGQGKYNEGEIN
jgi:proprotein convertase subtilisin/kexin type 5